MALNVKELGDITGSVIDLNLDSYVFEIAAGECIYAFKWAPVASFDQTRDSGVVLASLKVLPTDGKYCLRVTAYDLAENSNPSHQRIFHFCSC